MEISWLSVDAGDPKQQRTAMSARSYDYVLREWTGDKPPSCSGQIRTSQFVLQCMQDPSDATQGQVINLENMQEQMG